jgi:hypothetical protein
MKILALALGLLLPIAPPQQSPEALDKLLAPIALYPDQLLSQILMCSAKPGKVATLAEWLAGQTVKGSALQDAATKSGFEPSFVALALFPDVVDAMASQMPWTTALGEAFAADRSGVFASIQRLRAQAQKVGNLKDTPQQNVESKKTSSGDDVIVIEPSNPQVVYVPQYNSEVVYTQPATTTVVIQEDDDDGAAVAGAMIGFTAGVAMSAAWSNNYYYGPYGYGGGFYMYDDAWDDYYDHREDAREDWADNREDLAEERTERRENAGEQRTERTEARNTPEAQAQRDQRRSDAQTKANEARASGQTAATGERASTARSNAESRGYSGGSSATASQRSGTKSDAFSGYSSGGAERSASSRGQSSRSSSRSSGGSRGGGSRGGGGGRRR